MLKGNKNIKQNNFNNSLITSKFQIQTINLYKIKF